MKLLALLLYVLPMTTLWQIYEELSEASARRVVYVAVWPLIEAAQSVMYACSKLFPEE